MRKLFGTDGIRGVANTCPITADMVARIGKATAYVFKNGQKRHRILVGRDTRLSGRMIEDALVSGICSMGVDVITVGHLPTPAIALLAAGMGADAGIMISASHNPYQDNGIKIFSGDGLKLSDSTEEKIESAIFSKETDFTLPSGDAPGKALARDDAEKKYLDYLTDSFPEKLTPAGLKVVIDCANGAAYRIAPLVLERLGAKVVSSGITPNGKNINLNCGAMHPEVISAAVKEHDADIGIALDGDADRVILSDENGNVVDGDHIMALCALYMKEEGGLKQNTLVTTVMSNIGLDIAMSKAGINVVKVQVGDRYLLKEMLRNDYNFGGEQSGHLIFLDHSTTGDGTLSALQVLAIMKKREKKLSELAGVMKKLPQILVNVTIKEKKDLNTIPTVKKALDAAEKKLDGKGRIMVRFSGTQPLCRVMVEGPSKEEISKTAKHIAGLIEENIGMT